MKSDKEWRYWGTVDPLWAVASWDGKNVGGGSPWTAEEFLELGRSDFRVILRQWSHYGLMPGKCVEIGSGAGRMTGPLLSAFGGVVAVEISRGQVKKAKALLGEQVSGLRLCLVDRPVIPVRDGTCSGMFSCHVFQHFSEYGGVLEYLRESYRVLRSGASICFHIPVPGAHRSSVHSAMWLAAWNARASLRRVFGRPQVMEYHRYPAERILRTLDDLGFSDVELRIFSMSSNGDSHSFFFARKP